MPRPRRDYCEVASGGGKEEKETRQIRIIASIMTRRTFSEGEHHEQTGTLRFNSESDDTRCA